MNLEAVSESEADRRSEPRRSQRHSQPLRLGASLRRSRTRPLRQGYADANFSVLRRAALSLLKIESTLKAGIKNKRLTAVWDEAYLEKVLFGN